MAIIGLTLKSRHWEILCFETILKILGGGVLLRLSIHRRRRSQKLEGLKKARLLTSTTSKSTPPTVSKITLNKSISSERQDVVQILVEHQI